MKVLFSHYLKGELDTLDESLRDVIDEFIFCVTNRGIQHLKGRNKSSVPLNPHTKKEHRHAKFAQKYCLWHYHLGVPCYVQQANGDLASEYILHYCHYDDVIVLVDISTHPPFDLPSMDRLDY